MARDDDRSIPQALSGPKGAGPTLSSVNDALKQLAKRIHALEGRVGPIKLRDTVQAPGIEVDGTAVAEGSGALTVVGSGYDLFRANSTGFSRGCRVYNSANISIPDNSVTFLTFDSERFDTDGLHSTTSNTGRITFPVPGWWLIGASISFDSNATGLRSVTLLLNNPSLNVIASNNVPAVNGSSTNFTPVTLWKAAAGDYAQIIVLQNSGGPLNVAATASFTPEFWAWQIG